MTPMQINTNKLWRLEVDGNDSGVCLMVSSSLSHVNPSGSTTEMVQIIGSYKITAHTYFSSKLCDMFHILVNFSLGTNVPWVTNFMQYQFHFQQSTGTSTKYDSCWQPQCYEMCYVPLAQSAFQHTPWCGPWFTLFAHPCMPLYIVTPFPQQPSPTHTP